MVTYLPLLILNFSSINMETEILFAISPLSQHPIGKWAGHIFFTVLKFRKNGRVIIQSSFCIIYSFRENGIIYLSIFQCCIILPESQLCLQFLHRAPWFWSLLGYWEQGHSTQLHRLCTAQLHGVPITLTMVRNPLLLFSTPIWGAWALSWWMCSIIQQTLSEHLPCVKPCLRLWGYSSDWKRHDPCLRGAEECGGGK